MIPDIRWKRPYVSYNCHFVFASCCESADELTSGWIDPLGKLIGTST